MKKINVGILTFPISEAGNVPLLNLIDVLYHFSGDIYLITGNAGYDFFKGNEKIHAYGVEHESGANVVTRVVNFIYTQLKISYTLAKIDRNVDLWIFFIGGDYLVLPMLTAKLLRKNVVLAFAASSVQMLKSANDSLFKPTEILSKINCTLSNKIILYSENLIKEWNLERYRNKICTAYKHFLDFDKFKMKKKFDERENFVGYIGRFSEEKGTLNFVEAIPRILDERGEIRFLIGGAGQLQDKIEEYLDEKNLNDKVKLTGWVPHDELPDYLNELKLVVLPSYTEGLPNILLEAMACGTPVLATPVGAIPDVIKDGKTGFILENNSPECIAKNILNVLTYPNLDKIVKSTRELVEKEFTYKAAVERYREILEGTLK
uniref:D-inositol-3-phosphate glycosyltransferase n=1 Tax=Candidatus Methanophaga sp. ANME-1 ERB7 TaxID=2759913 RepID=A0A7G9Z2K0_9EURY|nr:D-inositol-3-phosphate glycosyltransferase [Methanosarcinales archaeon ANME-1 ERB7]